MAFIRADEIGGRPGSAATTLSCTREVFLERGDFGAHASDIGILIAEPAAQVGKLLAEPDELRRGRRIRCGRCRPLPAGSCSSRSRRSIRRSWYSPFKRSWVLSRSMAARLACELLRAARRCGAA